MNSSAAFVENFVATNTPSAGPPMNDSSTEIESTDNATRRRLSGTSAVMTCRPIDIIGTPSSPTQNDVTSNVQ